MEKRYLLSFVGFPGLKFENVIEIEIETDLIGEVIEGEVTVLVEGVFVRVPDQETEGVIRSVNEIEMISGQVVKMTTSETSLLILISMDILPDHRYHLSTLVLLLEVLTLPTVQGFDLDSLSPLTLSLLQTMDLVEDRLPLVPLGEEVGMEVHHTLRMCHI